jgi:opacity protein-like surface antigen
VRRGQTLGPGMLFAVLVWVLSAGSHAAAQAHRPPAAAPRPPFRPGSIEVDFGASWLGPIDFGSTTAAITSNQTGGPEYPLFKTSSQLNSAPGYDVRIGVRLTRMWGVEGAFQYSRPPIETRISGDVENAATVTARNDLSRYIVEVSGLVHLTQFRIGRNGSPFLLGGVGYLRELDEQQALIETGQTYHGGGGFKYLFSERQHGLVKGLGIRADARLCFKDGGFDFGEVDEIRRYFAGGASLIVAF